MLVILSASNQPRLAPFTGIVVGVLIACFITFEAPLSGMSMNPARTFGPDLIGQVWRGLWIYFVAPPLGMLAGGGTVRERPGAIGGPLREASSRYRSVHLLWHPRRRGGRSRRAAMNSFEESVMVSQNHYDVIIIGTGAGGGTLAAKLAPTGKRVLLLERGDYVPREKDNWSTRAVNVQGEVPHQGGLARPGRESTAPAHQLLRWRQHEILWRGALPASARGLLHRSSITAESRRPGPSLR